jgi:AmmeMemoRadiSam system protein B/AmmeMemoRadiSam system protein A
MRSRRVNPLKSHKARRIINQACVVEYRSRYLPLAICLVLATFLLTACATKPSPTSTDAHIPIGTSPTAQPPTTPAPQSTIPPETIRPPLLAGSWYPEDPEELTTMVDDFLAAVEPIDGNPIALIVPHAGYVFSGPITAYGFKQLTNADYDTVVIIASDHQLPLSDPISVWAEGGFETPLGIVPVDTELAAAILASDPRITSDAMAHDGEHPIEIELPFLQRVCPQCKIVPILMGDDSQESIQILAEALIEILPGKRSVVIASSDLSHYPTYNDAFVVDGATLAAIETGDPDHVESTIENLMAVGFSNLSTCACGEGPIQVAMHVANGLGSDTITVLSYANSGHSPYGDQTQVVGYGAVMFWKYDPLDLTSAQQAELLSLARTTLAAYLNTGTLPEYMTDDPTISRRSGAFVTLKKDGELRGCIGNLRSNLPLYQSVQEMTISAATSDPRFPQLTLEELDLISIEISVLSPLRRITDINVIEVGTHGLTIYQAGRQGVLLPQVAIEEGWDRHAFLENLCLKAELPHDCWQGTPIIYTFSALVFGED